MPALRCRPRSSTAVEQRSPIPALNSAGTNQAAIDAPSATASTPAVLLTLVSPEFQVQK